MAGETYVDHNGEEQPERRGGVSERRVEHDRRGQARIDAEKQPRRSGPGRSTDIKIQ